MYTPAWFLTLFSKSLSNSKFYRFFECFLVEGYAVIFKTSLAMIKLKEKNFTDNSMEENLLFINDMSFYDNITDDDFVAAIFSFDLSKEEVAAAEKDYTFKNRSAMRSLEDCVSKAYTKKVRDPRVKYEWSIEDYKNAEVSLV